MKNALTFRRWAALMLVYALPFLACPIVLPLINPIRSVKASEKQLIKTEDPGASETDPDETSAYILYQLRLPRVLLGLLAGGALAITGACFQVILRNPLAEPYTLGVTGGAAVGAVTAISVPYLAVGFGPFSSIQLFALAGATAALGLVYRLARRPHGISMNTMLLAGVTLSVLCGGIVMFIKSLAAPHDMTRMTLWLMGGLNVIGYEEVLTLAIFLVPGLAILLSRMSAFNQLSLGDEMASGHGVEVSRVQRMAFLGGGILTAATVSVAGPIGFVGLIVPHAVRRLSGFDQRVVLPASFLLGGVFLTLCDTAGRVIFSSREMPVGVFTAIVGGPLFIRILLGRRR